MSSTTSTTTFHLLHLITFILPLLPLSTAAASYNVSALFAFGDSTMDAGNNNLISNTPFRADHLPYGRDFPGGDPTGRFSNGKLSTDYLAQILGLKELLPAYLETEVTDNDLLTGVTFASGGCGLDERTLQITRVFNLEKELELFDEALRRMRKSFGEDKARNVVENALFIVSVGTNDLFYNVYLLPTRVIEYGDISLYQDFLLQKHVDFVQRLHRAGARQIVVSGLPPIGCLPVQVTLNGIERGCNDEQNRDSEDYNTKLQSHLQSLHATLKGVKLAYFDIYTPFMDMVQSPAKYGFEETLQGCCGSGLLEMGPACNVPGLTCPDASKYLFWDAVHPTQAAYWFLAENSRQTVLPYVTS